MNGDPQPLIISSSAPVEGNSRVRLKKKPIRKKIGFTDPFTNQKLNQLSVGLQIQLDEKQALNTELDDVTQQLKDAFKSFSEAQSHDEGRQPSSQPLSVRGQPESTQYRSVFENSPPGKVLAGEIRLPNCYTCMYNANERLTTLWKRITIRKFWSLKPKSCCCCRGRSESTDACGRKKRDRGARRNRLGGGLDRRPAVRLSRGLQQRLGSRIFVMYAREECR